MNVADPGLLPVGVLKELSDVVPEMALVGSFARDYWIHTVAGLPLGAQTMDVDITILVSSMEEYRHRLKRLEGPTGTGLVFRVQGHRVDVIPYGGITDDGIVEPTPGVTLDVTGMEEAVETAVRVKVDDLEIRIPTLASMIGLKVVAWAYRRDSTHKDARDLGPLLDATHSGPFKEAVWADEDAGDLWSYDPMLVGPFKAGREVRDSWQQKSIAHLVQLLEPSARAVLAARIVHEQGGQGTVRQEQLEAFAFGVAGQTP
ncbi:hypothetical protein [Oryzihumus sp.]|uniref:hypothetical protein n=1 Tax=Oryzihumus sp. TaxID=1968903 RepID=UPI002ED7B618